MVKSLPTIATSNAGRIEHRLEICKLIRHGVLIAPLLMRNAYADDETHIFDLPAQPLSTTLNNLAESTHTQLLYADSTVKGLTAAPVKGRYTARQALAIALGESGLDYKVVDNSVITVAGRPEAESVTTLKAMTVVGKMEDDPNDPYNKDYTVTNSSTATKTDTPIMETPVSIEVVTQEVLKNQQAFRIEDAVKNVSGVQKKAFGGSDNFIIRGFDSGRLLFRNGTRIPLLNLDFANIQQIEVLKGPASILFGRIEPGGMVNAVTKRPQEDAYYSLEQRFGSYDLYRTEANATGAITDDKSLLYRVDLSYLDTNSFRDNLFDERIFVAPSLTWKPTESTEFNLSYEYLDEDRPFDSGHPAIDKNLGQLPINRQFDQPGLFDNYQNHLVDLNWSHKFNDQWQLRNGVTAMFLDEDWQETYSSALLTDNRSLVRRSWFGNRNRDLQTVHLDLNGKFDTFGIKHNILVGGDYFSEHIEQSVTDVSLDTIDIFNPVFPNLDLNQLRNAPRNVNFLSENSWYGIYFQDQITIWDKLHILGGGRYDITTSGTGFSANSLDEANASFSDIEINKFNPRVGILYQPWQWLSVYGNYIESIGSPNNGRTRSGTPFAPESAEQYEAGFKTELFDGRLTSTVAFFHLTKTNVLTPDPNDPQFSIAIGETRSQGIEVDISGQITDELNLIGTYAWTDTKITQDNRGDQGNRLPFAPLHSGSLWLKYDPQQAFLRGFSFGAGVFAADKRYGDNANSFSDAAYARVDVMAAYKFNIGPTRLTTQVNINNVTDTEYFTLRQRSQNIPAEPLTVLGSIRLEY
ncbi:TonB-dependent siderophore receptor [Methylobacter marinus]|uniref:TonB-dependent siderophore receptor n=1 Tax=Methylobacter marinus TaxID=34058 RepID=UPI0018DD7EA2|nr:TonB-dependent receptor [Methylobacter marinus]